VKMANHKKKKFSVIGWSLVFVCIGINLYFLSKTRTDCLSVPPLNELSIKKPTLVVFFSEYECATCVTNLRFLNKMYKRYKEAGEIDFLGVVMSETNTDRKELRKVFDFPFKISDNFQLFRRLNIDRTPVILGLSEDHRILYFELIPAEAQLSESYLRKGIIDRLYYSRFFK